MNYGVLAVLRRALLPEPHTFTNRLAIESFVWQLKGHEPSLLVVQPVGTRPCCQLNLGVPASQPLPSPAEGGSLIETFPLSEE